MTDFLYPFIDANDGDAATLLDDLAASAGAKAAESRQLRDATLASLDADIDQAATAMARRFEAGGRLLTFGNGGSATDAAGVAALFRGALCGWLPRERPLPARSLVADQAVLTAIGNDVGFDLVFPRQLIAHARPVDIALGFSTSGNSVNLLNAFAEATRRGLLTVGLAGYGGGQMREAGLDHCLVVDGDSVHRIQETEAALAWELWSRVQARLVGTR